MQKHPCRVFRTHSMRHDAAARKSHERRVRRIRLRDGLSNRFRAMLPAGTGLQAIRPNVLLTSGANHRISMMCLFVWARSGDEMGSQSETRGIPRRDNSHVPDSIAWRRRWPRRVRPVPRSHPGMRCRGPQGAPLPLQRRRCQAGVLPGTHWPLDAADRCPEPCRTT